MSNAEQGISQSQTEAARRRMAASDGLRATMESNIGYQSERVLVYLLALALLGVVVVWATAKSALLLYGSLALCMLLTLLWGLARIRAIERRRAARARQAAEFESGQAE